MRLLMIFVIALLAHPAFAAKNDIIARRDEPLQTIWSAHKKQPYVKSREGLLRADTFSWRCYPVIGQSFKLDKKWLVLKLEVDGPGYWSTNASVIFAVDGEIATVPFGLDSIHSFRTLGGNHGVEIVLVGSQSLIDGIAKAREVWVTIPDGNSGSNHSVRLAESQQQMFREIMERYSSLKP